MTNLLHQGQQMEVSTPHSGYCFSYDSLELLVLNIPLLSHLPFPLSPTSLPLSSPPSLCHVPFSFSVLSCMLLSVSVLPRLSLWLFFPLSALSFLLPHSFSFSTMSSLLFCPSQMCLFLYKPSSFIYSVSLALSLSLNVIPIGLRNTT